MSGNWQWRFGDIVLGGILIHTKNFLVFFDSKQAYVLAVNYILLGN